MERSASSSMTGALVFFHTEGAIEGLSMLTATERVELTVKKPWAPIGLPLDYAAVAIDRMREGR